jgi:acetylornithine deacetylase/succinyl-diaminopimelate desuccinylase-like protein
MFAALAPAAAPGDAPGFADLAARLPRDPAFRSRFLAQRGQAALVQDTLALTVLSASPRTNVLPALAVAHLDVRLLPGGSCAEFAEAVKHATADPGVEVEPLLSFPSTESPVETPLFRAIERTAASIDPGALVVPRVIAGFTDAHYFRAIGLVAYGFTPRWLPDADAATIHGPNESISIENLERGIEALMAILVELDAPAF